MIARLKSGDPTGEAGMTLPELLVGMIVGLVVLMAAFGLLDTTVGVTARVNRNVDAIQRGRQAMDIIVRDLRSQVCLPTADPAQPDTGSLRAGSDTSVDFYADLGDGSTKPQRRVITFDGTAHTIVENVYTPNAAGVIPGTPSVTRTLLTDVYQDGSTPVLRYFGWNTAVPRQASVPLSATGGLAAPDLDKVARMQIAFATRNAGGTGTGSGSGSASLQDEVYRRAFDPNLTQPTPGCW